MPLLVGAAGRDWQPVNRDGISNQNYCNARSDNVQKRMDFNSPYEGEHLNRVALPLGGLGAGMLCLEGTGALSHVSLRHRPEIFHEPCVFSALSIKGTPGMAKVL